MIRIANSQRFWGDSPECTGPGNAGDLVAGSSAAASPEVRP
jgi:hypothetical protein